MRGLVLLFNRAAERLTGFDARDAVGKMNVRDLYPNGQASRIMSLIHGKDHGGPGRLEGFRTEVVAKDATNVPVVLSTPPLDPRARLAGRLGRGRTSPISATASGWRSASPRPRKSFRTREKQALIAELAGAAAHEAETNPLTECPRVRRAHPPERWGEDSPLQPAAAVHRPRKSELEWPTSSEKSVRSPRYETKS